MANNTTSRTPLRRISHSSLAALSASRNRDDEDDGSPLQHLEGAFAELSEAIQDMVVNLEALDAVNADLTRFNHGFAGFLYGLRMNAYTGEFLNVRGCRFCRAFMLVYACFRTAGTREGQLRESGDTRHKS